MMERWCQLDVETLKRICLRILQETLSTLCGVARGTPHPDGAFSGTKLQFETNPAIRDFLSLAVIHAWVAVDKVDDDQIKFGWRSLVSALENKWQPHDVVVRHAPRERPMAGISDQCITTSQ